MSDEHHKGRESPHVPFGSTSIRLTSNDWLVVLLSVALCFLVVPRVWRLAEPFRPANDYRIPHALSDDYWHYERWTNEVTARGRIPIIGDSVIWGEYVSPNETLSERINEQLGVERFDNAGLSGSHPLALEGLVKQYGAGVRGRRVILHCNLLWMSSADRDLQSEREISFNHARLVPQISRTIPSYKPSIEDRLGNAVDHRFAFRRWVQHVRIVHFESLDLPSWSLDHPYENPVARLRGAVPTPNRTPRHDENAWFDRGIEQQSFEWVGKTSSLQIQAFQNTVESLRLRGCAVYVIVGPFNEHLLAPDGVEGYAQLKQYVAEWLAGQSIPHLIPAVLPSEEYGDASHPLEAGYRRLANEIVADASFQNWLGN